MERFTCEIVGLAALGLAVTGPACPGDAASPSEASSVRATGIVVRRIRRDRAFLVPLATVDGLLAPRR
jgi:hypothetical protein